MTNNPRLRDNTLEDIKAWCFPRVSLRPITGRDKAAQALTEEHMESLQNVNPEDLLWVKN